METFEPGATPLDTAIARTKFAEQLALYSQEASSFRARGCWLLQAEFPTAVFAFAHPRLRPSAVLFGASIGFENFDLWPLSVRLINPFTLVPCMPAEVPASFKRALPDGSEQSMFQATGPNDAPFLCLPGIREYHASPAHSGDSWFLHRSTGAGSLPHILNILLRYGIENVRGYDFGIHIALRGLIAEVQP